MNLETMRLSVSGARFMVGVCVLSVAAMLVIAQTVSGWTGPSQAAPNGNVSAPINTGTMDQVKDGGLSLNSLAVFGNAILYGTSNYLNFGTIVGAAGFGIRNSAGTLEFKNSGGSWESLQAIVNNYINLAGQWITSGSNIYRSSGNVGIGTASPLQKLDVQGGAIRQVMSSTNDVWLQGGASTASGDNRNLALLGTDEDSGDALYLNYGGEYGAGTFIGGNVGIGNTNPTQKLDVTGYVKGTGMCIGSSCITSWSAAGGASCGSYAHMQVYTVQNACSCGGLETFLYQCRNGAISLISQLTICGVCTN